jgi:Domain of unknown function (DUF932)
MHEISNFKAETLDEESLRRTAPSIYASSPMLGVGSRYTFVPTARIVGGLRDLGWVPVAVQEQRIRTEARRGFQKHLIRFRRLEEMRVLSEWNLELVLINSHDAGCAYQLHAGVYRRICSNGLVTSEKSFEAIRFRHSGLQPEAVVAGSVALVEQFPRLGAQIEQFRKRDLTPWEAIAFARKACRIRYGAIADVPVDTETLLKPRRKEDEGTDLWRTLNRLSENLLRGGVSDHHRDRRGKLRSVRCLRGIDSQVTLNKGIWALAERALSGSVILDTENDEPPCR